jgi:hypothetical protein
VVVTNVPGPQIPLFLLGAEVEACYPVVNLQPSQGLGVALFSYAGGLFWGFVADPEIVPDLDSIPGLVAASFAELAEAAGALAPPPAPSGPSAPRAEATRPTAKARKARTARPSHRVL